MSTRTAKALLELCRVIVWHLEDLKGISFNAGREMRAALDAAEAEIKRDEEGRAHP